MHYLIEYFDIFDLYDCYNYLTKLRNFIRYIYDMSNSFDMFFDPLYEVLKQAYNTKTFIFWESKESNVESMVRLT